MSIRRIIAAILTFGLSEKMNSRPTEGVIITDGDELRKAMCERRVTFTRL
jgi:hypothetical protein